MSPIILCVITGVCFGLWPLIMKVSKLDAIVAAFVLTITSLITYLPFMKNVGVVDFPIKGTIIGITCGLLNGIGTILLQKLLASQGTTTITEVVFTIVLTQLILTAFGGWMFYGDPLTMKKLVGIVVAVVAVVLLTTK